MKAKSTTEIGYQSGDLSRLVTPEFRDIFIEIINVLDPKSFSRLARASSQLHDFCLHSKGISIPCDLWLDVDVRNGKLFFTLWKGCTENRRFWTVKRCDFYASRVLYFNFRTINFICDMDEKILHGTEEFLNSFGVHTVWKIVLRGDVGDWSDVIRFMQDKKVKQLMLGYHHTTNAEISPSIPDDILRTLFENSLDYFCYGGHSICDEIVLRSQIPSMNLRGATISKTSFKELIEKCAFTTSDIQWRIGRQPPSFHCSSAFVNDEFRKILDAFVSLDFHFKGIVPSDRPLIFTRLTVDDDPAYENSRWILRNDGKLVSFSFDWNHLYFSMSHSSEYPPCLL